MSVSRVQSPGVSLEVGARYQCFDRLSAESGVEVWRATDRATGAAVVVERIAMGALATWKTVELFDRSARALERLRHPAIPRLLDWSGRDATESSSSWLVREDVGGVPLARLAARLDCAGLALVAGAVLDALAYLHGQAPPLVHRDVRPEHVLVGRDGTVQLVGLGRLGVLTPGMCGGATMVGHDSFAPPAQLAGLYDASSDLHALGRTLARVMTAGMARTGFGRFVDQLVSGSLPTASAALERLRTIDLVEGPRGDIVREETVTDSETGALTPSAEARASLAVVDRSRYQRGQEAARGGMGKICWARDERLGRVVAIKELLSFDEASERRFEREIRLTARLQHPGIVQVLEAGRWPGGEPFYAMRRVVGRSLADVLDECTTLDQRLALVPAVLDVAEALAYAHSERVVHRDLKPSNVLLGAFGETVVIDWGLAKDLRSREPDPEGAAPEPDPEGAAPEPGTSEQMTRAGAVLGTPGYMAPEQARGEPIDERCDVFALGALLYHVLVGHAPFRGDGPAGAVARVLMGAPTPIRAVQAGAPTDLVAIVDKALSRDPGARYASAAEMAAELRRFQTGQLVAAHAYSRRALLARWLRRHRSTVTIAGVAVLLLGLAAGRTVQVGRRAQARELALLAESAAIERGRADELRILQARTALPRDPTRALAWLKSLSPGSSQLAAARVIGADAAGRGVARHVFVADAGISAVAFSGSLVVTTSSKGDVVARDVETGAVRTSTRCQSGSAAEVVVLGEGARVAVRCKEWGIGIWDLRTGDGRMIVAHPYYGRGTVEAFVASPDGRWLATAGYDRSVRVWDLAHRNERVGDFSVGPSGVSTMTLTPDGTALIVLRGDGALVRWDLGTRTLRTLERPRGPASRHPPLPGALALSRDGRTLAVARPGDGAIRVHELASGTTREAWAPVLVTALRFRDDGALESLDADGLVRVRVPGTRTREVLDEGARRWAHAGEVSALALGDGRIAIRARGGRRVLHGHDLGVTALAVSSDGRWVASASEDHAVRVWSLEPADGMTRLERPGDTRCARAFTELAFGSGERLFALAPDGAVIEWPATGGAGAVARPPLGRCPFEVGQSPFFLDASPDGRWIGAAGLGALWLRGPDGRSRTLEAPGIELHGLTFSPDGHQVAADGPSNELRVWDVDSGAPAVLLPGPDLPWASRHKGGVIYDARLARAFDRMAGGGDASGEGVAFVAIPKDPPPPARDSSAEDDRMLAGYRFGDAGPGAAPGIAIVGPRGEHLRELGRGAGVRWAAVSESPDRRSIAAIGTDRVARLFDVDSGRERRLPGRPSLFSLLAFSPDGTRLVAGGENAAFVWDLASGELSALDLPSGFAALAFSPDGRALAIATGPEVVLWRDQLPRGEPELRAWMAARTTATIELFEGAPAGSGVPR